MSRGPHLLRASDVAAHVVVSLRRWASLSAQGAINARPRLDAYDALGRPPTVDEVRAIEGQPLSAHCGECGEGPVDRVGLGWDPDYDEPAVYVCADCLRAALALLTPEGAS